MSKEKIDSFSASSENGFTRLVALGVEPAVLNASGLEEEDYQAIHSLLSPIASKFPFSITQSWQLQALTGKLCFYKTIPIETKDQKNTNLGHYATWSGSIEAFKFVNDKAPWLLHEKAAHERGIDRYIAFSSNPLFFYWMKDNAVSLMYDRWGINFTFVHDAAILGNIELLRWTKVNMPHLLWKRRSFGYTIAHVAAAEGNIEVLDWIKDNEPGLLVVKADMGDTIGYRAISSKNPECFNKAQRYSAEPSTLPGYIRSEKDTKLHLINKALDNNISLTRISHLDSNDEDKKCLLEIVKKLLRNQAIPSAMNAFTTLRLAAELCCSEVNETMQMVELPTEVWYLLLKHCLPEGIPESLIKQLFERAMNAVGAAMESRALLFNDTKEKIDSEISRLEKTSPLAYYLHAFGVMDSAEDKISRLKQLKASLDDIAESGVRTTQPQNCIDDWLEKNQPSMNKHRNRLYNFFPSVFPSNTDRWSKEIQFMWGIS